MKRNVVLIVIVIVVILGFLIFSQILQKPNVADSSNKNIIEETVSEEQQILTEPIRLAAHGFIPVGETRNFGNIGEILEVMQFGDNKISVDKEKNTVTCLKGGIACIRAKYRKSDSQNDIQTKCIACIDEIGSCKEEKKVSFDFQQFTKREGNSNWLESGNNIFYGVCDVAGKIRLQQPIQKLPKLYFTIVDALGSGAYSLGEDEYDAQRRGTITTYSGKVIKPNWIIAQGQEMKEVYLDDNANVHKDDPNCDLDPSCTTDPDLVEEGDIVQIGWGLPSSIRDNLLEKYESNPQLLDKLLQKHGITKFKWDDVKDKGEDVKETVFERLVSLQITDEILHFNDGIYNFKNRDVIVAYSPPWYSRAVWNHCFPDEWNYCRETFEEDLMAAEARQIQAWKNEGFNLWVSLPINFYEDKGNLVFSSWHNFSRPHFSNFNGILASLDTNPTSLSKDELAKGLPKIVEQLSNEIKTYAPNLPIVIKIPAPPLSFYTEASGLCEADYCPTDFKYSFIFAEKYLDSFQQNLGDSLIGFGVAMFEGSHFDIKQPVENKSGYELNRVGETGYNNPVLNIHTTQ